MNKQYDWSGWLEAFDRCMEKIPLKLCISCELPYKLICRDCFDEGCRQSNAKRSKENIETWEWLSQPFYPGKST